MMIKLKEFVKGQNPGQQVQPSPENPLEPSKAVAKPVAKPVVPKAKQQQPVKQPMVPAKKEEPVGEFAKIQNQIFNIKIRLNQLALGAAMKKFQMTLQSFKSKVTRNTTDKNLIQRYLAPLKGDIESLKGNLESLDAELTKLDKMTKVEEQ
jgi:hypothetical protein